MADGYVGLWPLVGAPQGDSSSVAGAATAGAHVSGEAKPSFIADGAAFSVAAVAGVNAVQFGWSFNVWPVLGLVGSMSLYAAQSSDAAAVSGEAKAPNVQTAGASAGATVTGVDASQNTGVPGFVGLWPVVGVLQGSTVLLPWGTSWSQAAVSGEGVFSVMGDYATPPRSVFDIPPPADFKIPGLHLEYGIPVSLRPPGTQSGEIRSVSSATGERRLAIVKTPEIAAASSVTGVQQTAAVRTSELTAGATVSGVPVGLTTEIRTGAIASTSEATAVDRSLASPDVKLGITAAVSAAEGERRAENAQTGASLSTSFARGVDASGYPTAAPAGSSSTSASVSGEAVATIVRTAQSEARAVIAAVSATLAIAEASAWSMAMVRGTTVSAGGAVAFKGRRRVGSLALEGAGARVGSSTVSVGRSRIGSGKP